MLVLPRPVHLPFTILQGLHQNVTGRFHLRYDSCHTLPHGIFACQIDTSNHASHFCLHPHRPSLPRFAIHTYKPLCCKVCSQSTLAPPFSTLHGRRLHPNLYPFHRLGLQRIPSSAPPPITRLHEGLRVPVPPTPLSAAPLMQRNPPPHLCFFRRLPLMPITPSFCLHLCFSVPLGPMPSSMAFPTLRSHPYFCLYLHLHFPPKQPCRPSLAHTRLGLVWPLPPTPPLRPPCAIPTYVVLWLLFPLMKNTPKPPAAV